MARGWTSREAEWLALVCLHSGVFLRSPHLAFIGRTNPALAHRFFRRCREYAVEQPWNGSPLRVCRIAARRLYRVLGIEHVRHRRPAPPEVVPRRLLALDYLLVEVRYRVGYADESMTARDSFSRRNRYTGAVKEITIREEAPEGLRVTVLETSRELGWSPSRLRSIICRVLRVRPHPGNWSEYPNVWEEVLDLIHDCEWFKVYDIIEAVHARFADSADDDAGRFAEEINTYFIEEGVGWQLVDGDVVTRGTESFESVVTAATAALSVTGRPTAAGHLHEALQDLSRRPKPDLSGAMYHAMGALEAVARSLTDEPKATLGQIIKRHPDLLPKPLDTALAHLWGYASNEARHVQEGREPNREEAELLVGLAAAMATYLTRKQTRRGENTNSLQATP